MMHMNDFVKCFLEEYCYYDGNVTTEAKKIYNLFMRNYRPWGMNMRFIEFAKHVKEANCSILSKVNKGVTYWEGIGLLSERKTKRITVEKPIITKEEILSTFVDTYCIIDIHMQVSTKTLYNLFVSVNSDLKVSIKDLKKAIEDNYPQIKLLHTRSGNQWSGIGIKQ